MHDFLTLLDGNDKIIAMIFAYIGWLVAGVLAWNNLQWRVKNLEQKTANIHLTEQSVIELSTIAKASDRRLVMLEERSS